MLEVPQPVGPAMSLSSILDGSGAFYVFITFVFAFLALILCTGIVIGRG